MADTLCDYTGQFNRELKRNPARQYPQSREGFFLALQLIPDAISGVKHLQNLGHNIHFLTAPSYKNAHCYTEKRLWIEKHFGLDICKNLIIAENKSLVMGGIKDENMFVKSQVVPDIHLGFDRGIENFHLPKRLPI